MGTLGLRRRARTHRRAEDRRLVHGNKIKINIDELITHTMPLEDINKGFDLMKRGECFGARWPQVRLRVRDTLFPRSLEQVRAGELDLALGPLPSEGPGRDMVVQPLFDSQSVLAARRGHPLARCRKLSKLVDANWVLTGPAGGPGDPRSLRFDAAGERTPQVRLECESFATLLALMPTLDVIGIMPKGFFDRYAPAMDLVELPIEDALPRTTIHALHRADTPLTLPAQRFHCDVIGDALGHAKQPAPGGNQSALDFG